MVEDPGTRAPRQESEEHIHDLWTVANIVTVLRLMLVPFAFAALISEGTDDVVAFLLFAAAASTDWLDGQIARRTGTVTAIGKAIDPLVDRLLIASGVVGLYIVGRLSIWIMLVLIARDVYLLWGAWRLERYRLQMPVTYLGKATTAILLVGFSLLILNWPTIEILDVREPVGMLMVYAGIALSLTSAVHYTFKARRMVRDVPAEEG